MTNTPERYDHHEDGMEIARDGDFVSYDDYAALLARAEKAEARVAELEEALTEIENSPAPHHWVPHYQHCVNIARAALAERSGE
jgi:hypothetical protein